MKYINPIKFSIESKRAENNLLIIFNGLSTLEILRKERDSDIGDPLKLWWRKKRGKMGQMLGYKDNYKLIDCNSI